MAKKEKEVAATEQPKEVVATEQPKNTTPKLRRVKVTMEELARLEKDKKLVGYDRKTSEAIIY